MRTRVRARGPGGSPERPGPHAPLLGPLPLLRLLLPALLLLPLLLQLLKLLPLELPFPDGGVAQVFGRIERNLQRENGAGWGGSGDRRASLRATAPPARGRLPQTQHREGAPGTPSPAWPRAPSLTVSAQDPTSPERGRGPRTTGTAPGARAYPEARRPAPVPAGNAPLSPPATGPRGPEAGCRASPAQAARGSVRGRKRTVASFQGTFGGPAGAPPRATVTLAATGGRSAPSRALKTQAL